MTTISAPRQATEWTEVCRVEALTPDRGVAVIIDGHQVALFLLHDGSVHVLDNRDPIAEANVLSRGIVGDRDGVPVVASPIYKQCFELATGRCLDDDRTVRVHAARIEGGRVLVQLLAS